MKKANRKTVNIWNNYYSTFDKNNKWLGNEYPNEPLVRFISNQRKNYNELLLSSLEEENDIFLPKISLNVFNNKYHYKLSHNEA